MSADEIVERVDLKRRFHNLYLPPAGKVAIVDVPPLNFLMIDGEAGPASERYQQAVEALYSASYGLKFAVKRRDRIDYRVMPLESLWWAEGDAPLDLSNHDHWRWTAMIMQPEFIDAGFADEVVRTTAEKKNLPVLASLQFASFHEGPSAQLLHTGPYAAEEPSIARLHAYLREHGYAPRGRHHEIYLSDPGRTAPEKLKTVLRQPFASERGETAS